MTQTYQLYIDAEWRDSGDGETFPAINPYTQTAWARIPQASVQDVVDAVDAAATALRQGWRSLPGIERGKLVVRLAELIERDADRLALLETTDNGKVIRETHSQMFGAARQLRFYAGYADKHWGQSIPLDRPGVLDFTVNQPAGVVALITAWNSPVSLLSNKLAPALATGNTVVVKPSEHASATTLEIAKLVDEAGFPPGVVNVVTGDHRVGEALCAVPAVRRISFTGSPGVGRQIAAAAGARLVPVTMELGGKSPNMIFADADLDKAIVGALAGIFAASGQTCVAGSRLLVQRPVYDQVVTALVTRARQIVLGDPSDPATEMGCVANEAQFTRILAMIDRAIADGAQLATGGAKADGPGLSQGYFIEPTIFIDVEPGSELAQEEVFGPVLSIIPFDEEHEAIDIANQSRYGLAAGVWTNDVTRALRITQELDAGTVWVNTYRTAGVQAPSGGVKDSGFGRERGEAVLAEYTTIKNVMIDYSGANRDPFVLGR